MDEIAKLKSELKAFYKNPKVPHYLKILSKFDLPSLRDVDKTINALISLRSFPRDAQGNFYIPSVKEMINAEKERIKKRKEERQERKKLIKRSEEERKMAKELDFIKLRNDLLTQIEEEPYRNSLFDFVEPTPGCHYDIGNSHGYVTIPIPANYQELTEIIEEEKKEDIHENDYTVITGQEGGHKEVYKYPLMEGFLKLVHEYAYMIAEQLYDNLGGRLDIQVFTVEKWISYRKIGRKEIIIIPLDRIHNTSFHSINSRNMIFEICDNISAALYKQYLMHTEVSQLPFDKGLVMKLQYRINRSTQKKERSRKYKGGSYINHFDLPCFTNNIRTNCITRMNNYNINKELTYIYNIVNPNDNLCFLRYVILIKFLSVVKQREYLKDENPMNTFHIPQLIPTVNPENLNSFIPFAPFVRYPITIANQYSEEIIKAHFPGLKHDEILTKIKLNMITKEYIIDCYKLMSWLNTTDTFPINADDAHLIEQFEELNDITINIYTLDKEAYELDCKKKLHHI